MYEIRDKDVIEDVRSFFNNKNHWAYQYGTVSFCGPNAPYHRKQIEVLFEKKYFHWVTDRAVNALLAEGYLKEEKTSIANFVYRANIRRIKREIRRREKIIRRYSDPIITAAIGGYAESLLSFLFRILGFEIKGRNTNEYGGIKWIKTKDNLDFIIKKEGIAYGVEIKNTLDYMEKEEFEIKLKICKKLKLIPLWFLRWAPATQLEDMKRHNGFIILFKTQIYPLGQEPLVRDIWNYMRLPVNVWKEIPPKIEKQIKNIHDNFKKIGKRI